MSGDRWRTAFLAALRRQGLDPHSIKNYKTTLDLFARFLDERGIQEIRDVDRETLSAYPAWVMRLTSRRGRPYSTKTRAQISTTVRRLFRYLVEDGQILIDPSVIVKPVRTHRTLPRAILTAQQMRQILAQPDLTTPWGLRDRALLELAYGVGLRFSELVDLTVGDVDLDERVVWVRRGKGDKDRVLPLGRWATHWLRRYLKASASLRRRQGTERVFLTARGNRLCNDVINKQVAIYARAAGIPQHVTLHTIRHTFATLLLKGGADVRKIQRLLGHARLTTTQLYTHLDLEDLRRVQDRYHPRERVPRRPPGGTLERRCARKPRSRHRR